MEHKHDAIHALEVLHRWSTSMDPADADGASSVLGVRIERVERPSLVASAIPQGVGDLPPPSSACIDWAQGPRCHDHSAAQRAPTFSLRTDRSHLMHGALMTAAWALFLPMGSLVPRCWRAVLPNAWFRLHRSMALVGTLTSLGGITVAAIGMHTNGTPHFADRHALVGLAIVVLSTAQVLAAFLRPAKPTPAPTSAMCSGMGPHDGEDGDTSNRRARTGVRCSGRCSLSRRKLWRCAHAVVGIAMLCAGVPQLVSGVRLSYGLESFYLVYGGGLAGTLAFGLLGLVLSAFGRRASSGSVACSVGDANVPSQRFTAPSSARAAPSFKPFMRAAESNGKGTDSTHSAGRSVARVAENKGTRSSNSKANEMAQQEQQEGTASGSDLLQADEQEVLYFI